MNLYNLKAGNEEHIFNITIEAQNIDIATQLARDYLEENNLEPISIWEVQ